MQKLFTAAQTTFFVSVVINFEDGAKPAGFLAVNKTDNATRHSEIQFYKYKINMFCHLGKHFYLYVQLFIKNLLFPNFSARQVRFGYWPNQGKGRCNYQLHTKIRQFAIKYPNKSIVSPNK